MKHTKRILSILLAALLAFGIAMLLANGFSLKEIQEWLGHSDLGTTANIYAHVLYKSKENMAECIGGKLRAG